MSQHQPVSTSQGASEPDAAGQKTVLVIDDDRELSRALSVRLRETGLLVACSHDGETGLRTLREMVPDVCVLDLGLPGLPGEEVLRAIGDDESLQDVKILVLTGHPDPDLEQRARKWGVVALFRKCAPQQALLSAVHTLLHW